MFFRTWKYYLVSYSHPKGFGHVYYKSKPHLDIEATLKDLNDKNSTDNSIVILVINRINKHQYKGIK